MALNFNKYIQKANVFINEVAIELGYPEDKDGAIRVLRAVLHALRNKIPPQESLQLIAELPMLIKAVYVDGWTMREEPRKIRHLADFLESVRKEDGAAGQYDFGGDYTTEIAIKAVFRVLKRHVSAGEITDISKTLPAEIRALMA